MGYAAQPTCLIVTIEDNIHIHVSTQRQCPGIINTTRSLVLVCVARCCSSVAVCRESLFIRATQHIHDSFCCVFPTSDFARSPMLCTNMLWVWRRRNTIAKRYDIVLFVSTRLYVKCVYVAGMHICNQHLLTYNALGETIEPWHFKNF